MVDDVNEGTGKNVGESAPGDGLLAYTRKDTHRCEDHNTHLTHQVTLCRTLLFRAFVCVVQNSRWRQPTSGVVSYTMTIKQVTLTP